MTDHRCAAVTRRAGALPAEYATKARRLDQTFCGTGADDIGPVETKLRTYDPVRGLVFGAFAEASPDAERLLSAIAASGAARFWRDMRATDPAQARGCLAWLLRRRWAMTALRENARLKLERMEFVGGGAAAAADRRATFLHNSAAAARRSACSYWQGPRIPSGGHGDI